MQFEIKKEDSEYLELRHIKILQLDDKIKDLISKQEKLDKEYGDKINAIALEKGVLPSDFERIVFETNTITVKDYPVTTKEPIQEKNVTA